MQSRHRITHCLETCRPLEDLRVSITGGVHFDLVKRVLRDINRSGQAPEEIIQQVRLDVNANHTIDNHGRGLP